MTHSLSHAGQQPCSQDHQQAENTGNRPAIARIHHLNLRHNYQLLQQQSQSAEIMAVVKANAYGHGMQAVAATLLDAGCQSFAVTDAREGSILRQSLSSQHHSAVSITLLSGLFHVDDAVLAMRFSLTPIITESQHIDWLQAAGFHGAIWIKIDSGMHRLGATDPSKLMQECQQAGLDLRGFMSHLACADDVAHPMNQQQVQHFSQSCDRICSDIPRSLLNSAGMVAMPEHSMDVVRPGLALYGIEPIPSQALGLRPVMTLLGSIMQLRDIPAGASISYGASFTSDKPMRIATVSLGYADGIPRALSNIGKVYIHASLCPIIGRVCMDYSLIDVTDVDAAIGDHIEFWGEHIAIHDVASLIHSISYTLLTGVGNRVQRIHTSIDRQ